MFIFVKIRDLRLVDNTSRVLCVTITIFTAARGATVLTRILLYAAVWATGIEPR